MRSWTLRPIVALLALIVPLGCSRGPKSEGVPRHAVDQAGEVVTESPAAALPSATRLDAEERAWVEETLAAMSLRQRVAQLVMPWISGAAATEDREEIERMLRWVEREEVGGLIVSTGRPTDLAAKLNLAQSRARVPLLIASDLETGPGMRLSPGGTDIPPAMALGAAGDERLAWEAGRVTAREARAVGIQLTLGPILDVNSDPENPIINVRSFGEDPERVARLGTAWFQGAQEAGLLAAGKHFPGHGATRVDSHVGLATIPGDSARLEEVELAPFRRAVESGIDAILVGHLAVPALQGAAALPASISPRIVSDLLRERLGFQGLVITDALNMGAITDRYPVGEASIRALEAGADVLLQPPGTSGVIDQIVRAVETGRLSPARVEEAARRVLAAKAAAGLHRGAGVAPDSLARMVGLPEHGAVAEQVAESSITLARDERGLVPLSPGARVLHVVYTRSGKGSAGEVLNGTLADAGRRMERVRVGRSTSPREYAVLREKARSADMVLVTVAVSPHQYQALGLSERFSTFVERLAVEETPVAVVSLGSPYVLAAFPSVPTYLLAWSTAAVSQRAAAGALLGRMPIRGSVPVSLPR